LLDSGQPLLVTADARMEDEMLRLTAQKIEGLEQVAASAAAGLRIVLDAAGAVKPLHTLLTKDAGGKGRISILVPVPHSREVEIQLPGGFRVGPGMQAAVQALPGVLEVQEV
jgi:DNA polymerase-3 subunit alpha